MWGDGVTTFSVKNFERFQHYKDRSPPWIKLYNELLDDYAFGTLPDATKMHLIAIWLLASRSDNKIPYDAEWVAKRINATEPVDLVTLSKAGFIIVDETCSNTLAERSEVARPEREGETEGEGERIAAADARDPRFHAVGKRVLDLCGDSPNLLNYGRVQAWLDAGADPELDIFPAIKAGLAKLGKPPNSLNYFDGHIADAVARRTRPMPSPSPGSPRKQERYDAIRQARESFSARLNGAGPGPDHPGDHHLLPAPERRDIA